MILGTSVAVATVTPSAPIVNTPAMNSNAMMAPPMIPMQHRMPTQYGAGMPAPFGAPSGAPFGIPPPSFQPFGAGYAPPAQGGWRKYKFLTFFNTK